MVESRNATKARKPVKVEIRRQEYISEIQNLDDYRWLQELTADRILTLVKYPNEEFSNDSISTTYITQTPRMVPGRVLIVFGRISSTKKNVGEVSVFLTSDKSQDNTLKLSVNWDSKKSFSQLSFLWHILIFADHIKWYSNLRHIGDFRVEIPTKDFNQIVISGNLRVDMIEMGFLPQVADVFEAEEICFDFNGGHLWSPADDEEYNTISELFKPERLSMSKVIQEEVIGVRALNEALVDFDDQEAMFVESRLGNSTVEYGDCFSVLRWNENGLIKDEIIVRECYEAVVSFICKVSMTEAEYKTMAVNASAKELREIDEKTRILNEVRKERKRITRERYWKPEIKVPLDSATIRLKSESSSLLFQIRIFELQPHPRTV
uniref:MATH domain-containing protein n=1 Tax=Syphacia muris TaxID=451379 RepID=A0A0N5AT74_9BILA